MPAPPTRPVVAPPPALMVEVARDGFLVGGTPVGELGELESRLRDAIAVRSDKTVFFRDRRRRLVRARGGRHGRGQGLRRGPHRAAQRRQGGEDDGHRASSTGSASGHGRTGHAPGHVGALHRDHHRPRVGAAEGDRRLAPVCGRAARAAPEARLARRPRHGRGLACAAGAARRPWSARVSSSGWRGARPAGRRDARPRTQARTPTMTRALAAAREAASFAAEISLADMRRGLSVLATIGSTAPFVGLFGTTFGIIHAFEAMSLTGSSAMGAISRGISEALVTTAFGLSWRSPPSGRTTVPREAGGAAHGAGARALPAPRAARAAGVESPAEPSSSRWPGRGKRSGDAWPGHRPTSRRGSARSTPSLRTGCARGSGGRCSPPTAGRRRSRASSGGTRGTGAPRSAIRCLRRTRTGRRRESTRRAGRAPRCVASGASASSAVFGILEHRRRTAMRPRFVVAANRARRASATTRTSARLKIAATSPSGMLWLSSSCASRRSATVSSSPVKRTRLRPGESGSTAPERFGRAAADRYGPDRLRTRAGRRRWARRGAGSVPRRRAAPVRTRRGAPPRSPCRAVGADPSRAPRAAGLGEPPLVGKLADERRNVRPWKPAGQELAHVLARLADRATEERQWSLVPQVRRQQAAPRSCGPNRRRASRAPPGSAARHGPPASGRRRRPPSSATRRGNRKSELKPHARWRFRSSRTTRWAIRSALVSRHLAASRATVSIRTSSVSVRGSIIDMDD